MDSAVPQPTPEEALAMVRRSSLPNAADIVSTAVSRITSSSANSVQLGIFDVVCARSSSDDAKVKLIVKRMATMVPAAELNAAGEAHRATIANEARFYQICYDRLQSLKCTVPRPLLVECNDDGTSVLIVMTRLVGESRLCDDNAVMVSEGFMAMDTMAKLHAAFWGAKRAGDAVASGVQAQGTYWTLRPSTNTAAAAAAPASAGIAADAAASAPPRVPKRYEWEPRLLLAARAIHERLRADRMQAILHGDAKDGNMVFQRYGDDPNFAKTSSTAPTGPYRVGNSAAFRQSLSAHHKRSNEVADAALLDFEHAGMGPPSKDLAYFLCCASGGGGAEAEALLVERYHTTLSKLLVAQQDAPPTRDELETSLSLAYCDLGRYFCDVGWRGNDISARILAVLDRLDGGTALEDEEAYIAKMAEAFPVVAVPPPGGGGGDDDDDGGSVLAALELQ